VWPSSREASRAKIARVNAFVACTRILAFFQFNKPPPREPLFASFVSSMKLQPIQSTELNAVDEIDKLGAIASVA